MLINSRYARSIILIIFVALQVDFFAKGYYVYRREAKGKKYTKWKKVKNIKKNTTVKYKDSKLKKGKTYQYKVVAYNRKNKGTSAIKKIVIK